MKIRKGKTASSLAGCSSYACGMVFIMINKNGKYKINRHKMAVFFTVLALATGTVNTTCISRNIYVDAASNYFSMVETNFTIMVGETDFIETNLAADIPYSETDLKWKSDNSNIVIVDETGVVTGVAEGSAVITASMPDGSSETCTITVSGYINDADDPDKNIDESENNNPDDYSENPPFTKLTVTKQMTVYVGGSGEWAEISYEPQDADEETITWKSSNSKVATVEDGLIKGIKSGTVKIIAMTPNNISATCTVTVEKPQIKLEKSKAKLKVGKRVQIKATCSPDTKPSFKSQNKSIASVTANGLVKAKKKGKTVIVVKANGVSKKFNVTVVR